MRIQTFITRLMLPASLAAGAALSGAQERGGAPGPVIPGADQWPAPRPPEVRALDDGRVAVGKVIVDPETRTAAVPVKVNMTGRWRRDASGDRVLSADPIEYLLVHENGKSHESLFTTTARPFSLHTAMLLLGLQKQPTGQPERLPPATIDDAYLATAPLPEGAPVLIHLQSSPDAEAVPVTGHVHAVASNGPWPARQPWTYNGSYFMQRAFIAEVDGSFVSLITDPAALVNNTDPRRSDDLNWFPAPREDLVPGASMTLIFHFPEKANDTTTETDE
jgi:hypothetical protein